MLKNILKNSNIYALLNYFCIQFLLSPDKAHDELKMSQHSYISSYCILWQHLDWPAHNMASILAFELLVLYIYTLVLINNVSVDDLVPFANRSSAETMLTFSQFCFILIDLMASLEMATKSHMNWCHGLHPPWVQVWPAMTLDIGSVTLDIGSVVTHLTTTPVIGQA